MSLTRVTISGADDRVDPKDLVRLTEEFPFVEWGILWSKKRAGTPRYPSVRWIESLVSAGISKNNLSAHLCGEFARELLAGGTGTWLSDHAREFARVQVNGYEPAQEKFLELCKFWKESRFILQVKSIEHLGPATLEARFIGDAADILFDVSGGLGISPSAWPVPPSSVSFGYAGGIGPATVASALHGIQRMAGKQPFWIDMETGVREADDVFSLTRVRQVLLTARPWIEFCP